MSLVSLSMGFSGVFEEGIGDGDGDGDGERAEWGDLERYERLLIF